MSKAERTREFIIEKTAPVFNVKGYAGTSINDLIHATGLSKGSIYGNFENKDEVALAAFDYNIKLLRSYQNERLTAIDHSVEKLLVYTDILENFHNFRILQSGCPILNTATEADDTHPALSACAKKALLNWREDIASEIVRGIEKKEIKDTVNAKEFAIIMIAMMEGSLMQSKVTNTLTEVKTVMRFLRQLITDLKVYCF